MPGGLSLITQDSFAAGMFRDLDTQRIPANGTYDIVNGLLDADDGVIYRRGGSGYQGTATPSSMIGIFDVNLVPGRQSILIAPDRLMLLALDTTPEDVVPPTAAYGLWNRRGAVVDGVFVFPFLNLTVPSVITYGGSRQAAAYSTGTVSVTNGSTALTGVGTSWATTTEPGSLFADGANLTYAVVASVNSNTSITLAYPWQGTSLSGSAYHLTKYAVTNAGAAIISTTDAPYLASVASRLVYGAGNRVAFSAPYNITNVAATDYHALPDGGVVIGLQPIGSGSLLVFATTGVYRIDNMAFDLTDAAGNPQQTLRRINSEMVLWHENGIGGWQGAIVVPATDDVYLFDGSSGPVSIGGPVRSLYRSYAAAGYTLGLATVARGHYILPILNDSDSTWVDTFVCNLATRAWSRMSGYSGQSVGFATRVALGATRTQKIWGINGTRVLDCTWFSPTAANKNEANGTTHSFSVTTRDFTLGTLKGLAKKIRLWTEGVDAGTDSPTLTASYATGIAGSSFTALTGTAGASTGDAPAGVWTANAGGKHVRFQFASTSPWASLKIKALDLFVRPRGRQ